MGRIKSGSLVQKTFLYLCKRKQKEEAELGQEYFEGSITPVTWAAHLGGAEAAVTTGEQRRNLPCAFFCTGCLGTCSFHTALLGWVFLFAFETKFSPSSLNYIHYTPCIPHMCVTNPLPTVSWVRGKKWKHKRQVNSWADTDQQVHWHLTWNRCWVA